MFFSIHIHPLGLEPFRGCRSVVGFVARQCSTFRLPPPWRPLVRLPVRATVTIPAQVQLDGVQTHGSREVDPPPGAATGIARPQSPPEVVAAVDAEMLQKQACVHGNEDRGRERAEESHEPIGAFVVLERGLIHDGLGSQLSHGRNNSRGAVKDNGAICQGDDDAGRDGLEGGVDEPEGRAHGRWEGAEDVKQRRVRGHDDRGERWEIGLQRCRLLRRRGSLGRGLVVGKDLVDAEDNVGKEQRRLDGVTAAATDAESTKENRRGHGHANERSVEVVDLREAGDPPEEVGGARDDGSREDEEDNLSWN